MQINLTNSRRLGVLYRILNHHSRSTSLVNIRLCSTSTSTSTNETVTIGQITKVIKQPKNIEYVPRNYLILENASQTTIHHLRWMLQKDLLGQDIFLLGPPGPSRRLLAFQYLELTKRELEYVALSRDTTEADLKQRREIINGTSKYFDQSAVRAAIEGRVLVLEGIEKAERNVLPVLNNLLENREMHLEDGRLLIPADRYDQLLQKYGRDELEKWKLVRVDEDFRVIALGLPVPRYIGNLLDPPLRSRFQARDVSHLSYQENLNELQSISSEINPNRIEHLTSVAYALISDEIAKLNLPHFPVDNLSRVVKIMEKNVSASTYELFYRLYPYKAFLQTEGVNAVENLLQTLNIDVKSMQPVGLYSGFLDSIKEHVLFKTTTYKSESESESESNVSNRTRDEYIETDYQNHLINELLISCTVSDVCLIGPRGCGKTTTINKLAHILQYEIEPIVLYQDMTARDLIQQRTTLLNGDTVWKNSPLITAALQGKMAILDGIHRIHPSTLAVLHRLVHDREIQLHDGKRLIDAERYEAIKLDLNADTDADAEAQMTAKGIFKIHPQFRIIALAEPPTLNSSTGNWLSAEILTLFLFHEMRTLSKEEEKKIITSMYGSISKPLHKIINLAHTLRNSSDPALQNLAGSLSTRQLLHIASRLAKYPHTDPYDIVQRTFLSKFLPNIARNALESLIFDTGLQPSTIDVSQEIKCEVNDGILTIGNTSLKVYQTDSPTKIPNILFYDVPQHIRLLEYLLQDFILGSHLLLVGNQGVGKNKIADRLLQLLNRPREYIQLHRDTTVQTLTLQPSVKDGLVIYEDSPLVKAVKFGHFLVVDEADKAPTHVTCILKTLVESGEMILSDGRRIVKPKDSRVGTSADIIETHPGFRMIVLANRPGFPFLGNDFFGALGDLFSCHAVDNPSIESEISLLTKYGPDVPKDVIQKLVMAFGELRTMADQGLVSYPYSTREVVNIVKHIQKFPNEDITSVIFNVFDFDRYNDDVLQTLAEVLSKHGFPSKEIFTKQWLAIQKAKEHLQVTVNRKSGLDTSAPKHGKEDPNNDPHVGGNTWAGGTGGRDTAGLGGKGGPYRLDKGHKVHQLSDEEKDAVPDHVKKAAREMNRKAFKDKLKEIDMSEYDANLYGQFYDAVARPIQSLRVVLSSLQAKSKERQWTRHQTSGELDDNKLIEGITGEKTIYRRRADHDPDFGTPQIKPKRLKLVVDVSGSMYRFNSYDGRLDRELEAVVLVMEAFEGYEDKFKYDIVGHSGDHHNVEFVLADRPPKNNKERLDIIRHMHAHSQYCWNGDHTLEATTHAIQALAMEDCDEAIVVVLSDANLSRYGISAKTFANALNSNPKVSAHAIFIGSLGDQAENLVRTLGAGRGFVCTDCSELPQILKQIFTASVLR